MTILAAGLVFILTTLFVVAGLASINYFMFHQNNTIPSTPGLSVYQSDGITPVPSGTDASTLWVWTGTQFTLSLVIHNTGNVALTTGLNTSGVPAGWTVSMTGNGTLATGGIQAVTIISVPPTLAGGTSSGDYDLWITG
jgi:uncharacterized membrane protein